MNMSTLTSLLNEAKNYLTPELPNNLTEKNRKQFIKFLERNELFEEISSLIEKNPSWQELALKKGIFYIIEFPTLHQILGNDSEKYPQIYLLTFEQKQVPVIKIICRTKKEYY